MTFEVKLKVDQLSKKLMGEARDKLSEAVTGAMKDAAMEAVRRGRNNIEAQGFSDRWQNTLKWVVYPRQGKASIDPAAVIYHKIEYAEVFERPTVISPKAGAYLWIPIKANLASMNTANLTPKKWLRNKSGLQFVQGSGGPLLVVSATGRQNSSGLAKGTPVFFGLKRVSLNKRFNIMGATRTASEHLSQYFDRRLKDLDIK